MRNRTAFERGREDARAERFGEHEHVARTGAGVGDDALRVHVPVTAIPYFGSASLIVWPPRIATPAARATREPPFRMRARIARSRSSGNAAMLSAVSGRAAHRVDVGERVGRGDAAEVVRIVDDRREEIDRLHEREIVAQLR